MARASRNVYHPQGDANNFKTVEQALDSIGLGGVGKVTITQPATNATLTIADTKTLTVNKTVTLDGVDGKTLKIDNSIEIAGTDGKKMTFPSSDAKVAALDLADQTLSGGANVTVADLGTQTSGTLTIDCGTCPLQKVVNGGVFTLAAPSSDGSCILKITNNGSAGAITPSGFTVSGFTGDALDTTNGHIFFVTIIRIGGTSTYFVKGLQ